MNKSPSNPDELPWVTSDLFGDPITEWPEEFDDLEVEPGDELPVFKMLGVATPDSVAAQLGYIHQYLRATANQYTSLDERSQRLFMGIYMDMALVVNEQAELASRRNRQGE